VIRSQIAKVFLLQRRSCLRFRDRSIICQWKQTLNLSANSSPCAGMSSFLSSMLLFDIQSAKRFLQQATFLHIR